MEAWREELYHFDIKGMKWGVRRYQNADGTYTDAGKKRYFSDDTKKKLKTGAAIGAGVAAGVGAVAGAKHYSSSKAFKRGLEEPEAVDVHGNYNKVNNLLDRNIKRGKDKENVSPVESILGETGKGLGSIGAVARDVNKIKQKNVDSTDLSKKSSEQLKKEIDRMQLEVRWQDLNQQQLSRGKATVEDYVEVGKDIAMGAASIATIAATIYKIKHG